MNDEKTCEECRYFFGKSEKDVINCWLMIKPVDSESEICSKFEEFEEKENENE